MPSSRKWEFRTIEVPSRIYGTSELDAVRKEIIRCLRCDMHPAVRAYYFDRVAESLNAGSIESAAEILNGLTINSQRLLTADAEAATAAQGEVRTPRWPWFGSTNTTVGRPELLLARLAILLPRRHREPLLSDISDDVLELRDCGWAEERIMKFVIWQVSIVFSHRVWTSALSIARMFLR